MMCRKCQYSLGKKSKIYAKSRQKSKNCICNWIKINRKRLKSKKERQIHMKSSRYDFAILWDYFAILMGRSFYKPNHGEVRKKKRKEILIWRRKNYRLKPGYRIHLEIWHATFFSRQQQIWHLTSIPMLLECRQRSSERSFFFRECLME